MLLFRKIYYDAIRCGTKTTTLRYWPRAMIRAGSLHTVRGLGRIRIHAVRVVRWKDLTDADARADGFADLASLRRALRRYYPPEARRGRTLYQVHFTYLPPPPGDATPNGSPRSSR